VKARRGRSNRGGLILASLPLALIWIAACFLSLFIVAQIFCYVRAQAAVNTAALMGARDIARLVYADPNNGLISISDLPPTGRRYLSAQGESVPVHGINTLIAAARMQSILAHALDQPELISLAHQDALDAQKLSLSFTHWLKCSLQNESLGDYLDSDGQRVHVRSDILGILSKNLPPANNGSPAIKNLTVSLGWIEGGTETNTNVPEPLALASMKPDYQIHNKYKSCVNVPAYSDDFIFVPAGSTVSLVSDTTFRQDDNKHPIAVLRVEADVLQQSLLPFMNSFGDIYVHVSAAAIPCSRSEYMTPNVLIVDFPSGIPLGIDSLKSILQLQDDKLSQGTALKATSGDFYGQDYANLRPSQLPCGGNSPNARQIFAFALHSWLKESGTHLKLDSLLSTLDVPLTDCFNHEQISPVFIVRSLSNGNSLVESTDHDPCLAEYLPQGEIYSVANFSTNKDPRDFVMSCRNFCATVEEGSYGQITGQPICSNIVNWSELPYFRNEDNSSDLVANARNVYGLQVIGRTDSCQSETGETIPGSIEKNTAQLITRNGNLLSPGFPKYCYSGGISSVVTIKVPYIHAN
jgi:hypothetical protein